jgi:hypothetical protein
VSKVRNFKISSGGQTGADRAALDFAIGHRIRHGGWCPAGRAAEDGRLTRKYRLKETPSSYPAQRTRWNARDADATVIFSRRRMLRGGTRLTEELARKYNKPLLKIFQSSRNKARLFDAFLRNNKVGVLNIAGPRESGQPGVYNFTRRVLESWFALRKRVSAKHRQSL